MMEILGVKPEEFLELELAGMPVERLAGSDQGRYDTARVIWWVVRREALRRISQ